MSITFSIISRGIMLVNYNGKEMKISGELTFTPPVFYADINSMKSWEIPNQDIQISDNEKEEIINCISKISEKKGMTKVIFE